MTAALADVSRRLGAAARIRQSWAAMCPKPKLEIDDEGRRRNERVIRSPNLKPCARRLQYTPDGLALHSDESRGRLKFFLMQYTEDGEACS